VRGNRINVEYDADDEHLIHSWLNRAAVLPADGRPGCL
jgi:hypothetical protein